MSSISRAWLTGVLAALLPGGLPAQGAGNLVVRQLRFEGNGHFPKEVLAAAIATTNSSDFATSWLLRWTGLGEKRRLNEREFRADVERLRLFYRLRGYREVQVDTTVLRTEADAYITFRIREGLPLRLVRFEVEGLDSLPDRGKVASDLSLREGRPYDRTLLFATADTLQSRLRNRGYPEARVSLSRQNEDLAARTADVALRVTTGPRAVIGEIQIEGTRQIDSSFVRLLLATRPGRVFRESDIAQSQLNLYRSELFRFASVGLATLHFQAGSGVVPLTVQVAEGPMHHVSSAAGYGTNDCFRTGAGWTVRNALSNGQIFDVAAQVSKLGVGEPFGPGLEKTWLCSALKQDTVGSRKANYNITTSFRRPIFLSPANTLTGSLFAERRSEFAVYLREDIGGSLTLTRVTTRRIPITLTYRLAYGRTDANAVSFCGFFNACTEEDVRRLRQRRRSAMFTVGVQRIRTDDPLDPDRGSVISVEATHSSPITWSSTLEQFTRFVGDAAFYRPIGSSVLGFHLRAGAVFAPRLSLDGGASNFVPPEQRFYAGGPNDVRGYNRNQLGPLVYVVRETALDGSGTAPVSEDSVQVAATGGNTLVVANAELRVPSPVFPTRMRLAAFVDGGGVWERGGGTTAGPVFRITPGIGVRFVTPLGPVRLDAAYNGYDLPAGRLYKVTANGDLALIQDSYQKREQRSFGQRIVFQFSVGQAF